MRYRGGRPSPVLEHQRDPIAVALVGFRSRDRAAFDQHWEKLLADDSCLKKTGRGIATEALSAFLRLEQTRPLHAGVATHNAASIRVLQKCGFTLLGPEAEASDDDEASHLLLQLDA